MKEKTFFTCQECGYKSIKWQGRCPDCNSWNSFVEEFVSEQPRTGIIRELSHQGPQPISDVETLDEIRFDCGLKELDRILGGGLVVGSVVLVGGDPGIGKSTLLLQASDMLSRDGKVVLYVSGEESVRQTKLRAERLGVSSKNLYILSETSLTLIVDYIKRLKPSAVIIDSIQVLYSDRITSSPGSVSQVRECAGELVFLAKNSSIAMFIIGHMTKDGSIAGPRVLEHIVDTVLYFEGESHTNFRILRSTKNRFGSTNEVGLFQMSGAGLVTVENPSEMLLSQRPERTAGSVVVPTVEGTRPLLVEIQALVGVSNMTLPRRRVTGVDFNRTSVLIAILEKRVALNLASKDIYINVAGGIKIDEPACDLGIAVAIASSFKDTPTKKDDIVFGELGLGGEIRAVDEVTKRIAEAEKLGFKRAVISKFNMEEAKKVNAKLELIGTDSIKTALDILFQ
ncbi:MAG: DNA repair protein RadA [Candidatus Omnitrophota bacterium]